MWFGFNPSEAHIFKLFVWFNTENSESVSLLDKLEAVKPIGNGINFPLVVLSVLKDSILDAIAFSALVSKLPVYWSRILSPKRLFE